jgi:hypothetical protein
MRVVMLRALLLTVITLLASSTAAQAQGADYPADVGVDQTGPSALRVCVRFSPGVCSRNDQGGVTPGGVAYRGSNVVGCNSLSVGYAGCISPYAAYDCRPTGGWTSSHYQSSTASPYFAPGGEAYSYAGYGGFRASGYGIGTTSPDGAYGTTAIAGCSAEYGPPVLPATDSPTLDSPNRIPGAR